MAWKPNISGPLTKTVVVLGGGLAGLSAARRLLDRNYGVTLVEMRRFLGGRTFSFTDPTIAREVDNGQHVFLGCCTYYMNFLETIGIADKTLVQQKLRAEIILNGKSGILSSTPFLGDLHLLPSFIKYPHLTAKDKVLAAHGLLRIKLTDRTKHREELDSQTFYEWLKSCHQTERAINNLWNVITLPTLNDDVRNVSAHMGIMVFQEGLLKGASNATIGLSKVGLTSLTDKPSQQYIKRRGGRLELGKTIKYLAFRDGQVDRVELSDGSVLKANAYVSALPFDALMRVLPAQTARGSFFSPAAGLSFSPIIGVHIWYDRQVMDQDFLAFLNSPVQWVFNKSLIQCSGDSEEQYVCISVSGAWDFINRPKKELERLFAVEMEKLFPRAKDANIQRCRVVKQPQATFRCIPGAAKHRLPQITPFPNLFLAGEWTDTGWPPTMEGAVRSGVFAADALANRI